MSTLKLDETLLTNTAIDPRWAQGPFMAIKLMLPKAKGKRFEQIAQAVFEHRGMTVKKPTNSDHDRIVDGSKFEIKGSTVTHGTDDVFSFLQVRPAQDYEYLILEAFFFDGTIKYYKLDKAAIQAYIEQRVFKPQHGGNRGNSGTFLYNGNLKPFEQYFWFEVKISQ